MTRERWFYAEGHRRMGPVQRRELVDVLLQLTDPRACLIWRRGLQAWTPASEVPEIEGLLAPFAQAEARPHLPPSETTMPSVGAPPVSAPSARRGARRAPRPRAPLYAAGAIGALVIGASAWLVWPRPAPRVLPSGPSTVAPDAPSFPPPPRGPEAGGSATEAAVSGGHGFTGWADQETDLPPAELRRLRGVGGWAGDKLTVTLYNGSSWRVTEIFVLTSRMEGDHFVDAVAPQRLLPVGGAPVEGAVQDLLQKVAPDRKRAGVNPADTGPFEVVLGPQPAAYRWKIERARGYPPRSGP